MLSEEKLRERLMNSEDRFTERKSQGVSTEDICKTLVAFANSLPDGQEGVLFIGISDKGDLTGVGNPDKMQKGIRKLAEGRCYPPISVQCQVLNESGVNIIAVTVFSSRNKPHFAGPAYVRIGSESVVASREMFEELITSRNDKARQILRYRDQDTTILLDLPSPYDQRHYNRFRCKVKDCNPHYATFSEEVGGTIHSVNIDNVGIRWEGQMNMPLIIEYSR